jgi:hypothetical protein
MEYVNGYKSNDTCTRHMAYGYDHQESDAFPANEWGIRSKPHWRIMIPFYGKNKQVLTMEQMITGTKLWYVCSSNAKGKRKVLLASHLEVGLLPF